VQQKMSIQVSLIPPSSPTVTLDSLNKRVIHLEILMGVRPAIVDCSPALESAAMAAGFDVETLERSVYQLNQREETPVVPIPHESLRFINYADLVAKPAAGHYIVMAGPLNFVDSKSTVYALHSAPYASQLIALSSNSSSLTVGPLDAAGQPAAPWWITGSTDGWQCYGPTPTPLQKGIYIQGVENSVARLAFYVKV
jgi:hypothetical protein